MKILVISDSHGYDANFYDILSRAGKPDMLIHCGDVQGSADIYRKAVNCEVKMVAGNNDIFFTALNTEEEFDIGSHHIFVTHGNRYGVSYGSERIVEAAASRGADIVLYGHTHIPAIEYDHDFNVWAVNPGSISLPRQTGHKASYIIMEIDDNDEVKFHINYLD